MIVMGGIIGSGIFINPYVVARQVHTPFLILGAWAAGGLIALAGAFIYAELAALRPYVGGQYAYIREAFHPAAAFIYGWTLLLVVQSGGMAAVAVTFARYFLDLTGLRITDWGVATGVAQSAVALGRGYSNTVIADNEIYMTSTAPSYSTQATLLLGIFVNDASASFSILRNSIHDILPNSAVTVPTNRGIRISANAVTPSSLVANNFITLDDTSTTTLAVGATLYGISDEAAGTTNFYFNSVRIGGTQSTGSGISAAFDRQSTGVTTLQNNILYNARTNSGSGSGKHYALRRSSSSGTVWSK